MIQSKSIKTQMIIKSASQPKNVPLIIIDERERGEIRKAFQMYPCRIKIRTLPVADYIVSSKIGIERKRGDDFAASLCDGRFFEQLERMNSTFKRPMIILEDFTRMFSQNIYEQSLLGALTYAMFKLNIPIIPTQNSIETARTIWSIAKAEQKIEKFKYIPLTKKEQKIDKKAQVYFLEGLMNVSVKKANILLDKWKTPGNVLNAILKTEITKTKAGKEKGIAGPLSELKGFGLKFLKSNKELLDIIND